MTDRLLLKGGIALFMCSGVAATIAILWLLLPVYLPLLALFAVVLVSFAVAGMLQDRLRRTLNTPLPLLRLEKPINTVIELRKAA